MRLFGPEDREKVQDLLSNPSTVVSGFMFKTAEDAQEWIKGKDLDYCDAVTLCDIEYDGEYVGSLYGVDTLKGYYFLAYKAHKYVEVDVDKL
jgi:hypothetical protein